MQQPSKVAVVTHARKEPFFCTMWSKYYGGLFGEENLFLVKDGKDWDLPPDARFGTVIPVSFPRSRKECDAFSARFLGQTCAELLLRYDVVLRIDVDEFLIVDPAKGSWDTVLREVMDSGYLYAFGLDVVQNDAVERRLDPGLPVLSQRRHAFVNGGYCKPCAISRPVSWTASCHTVEDGPVRLSSALMLVHLASMDRRLFQDRLRTRGDFDKSSYAGHASSRARQFRAIRAASLHDLDHVDAALRTRISQDDAGAPAVSPRFQDVAMPDGSKHKDRVPVRLPDRMSSLIPALAARGAQPLPPSEAAPSPEEARLSLLRDMLRPERLTIVADVGASPIERPPYAFLLEQGACEVWGFEPQPNELDRLVSRAGQNEHYLPLAIGDGTIKRLYMTKHSGFTSTLRPNKDTSRALNRWRRDIRIESEVEVQTARLDDVQGLPDFDLLKIDIQGGEVDVFRNATARLGRAIAVVTETAAIPIYQDQPLLGDQMICMRGLGYDLHKFAFLRHVAFRGSLNAALPKRGYGDQITDGDAIFVRALLDLGAHETEALKHLCILADFVFDSPSLALKSLEFLIDRDVVGRADAQRYADLVMAKRLAR